MADDRAVELTVEGAEKRDAGRGIARLSQAAQRELGVLSGDTVVVEGDRQTVVDVWPGRAGLSPDAIQIDADTRANAGVTIGETVRVAPVEIADANVVVLTAPAALRSIDIDDETIARYAADDLEHRPVQTGEQVRIERLGGNPFRVRHTDPSGTVRVTADTDVEIRYATDDADVDVEADVDVDDTEAGDGTTLDDGPSTLDTADRTSSGEMTGGTIEGATGGTIEGATGGTTGGTTYEDIGGLDEELELVRETIELPLSEPEVFARLGIDPPKGVLLYGPPGTGKTLIARAVANEVDATFLSVSGPEITSKYKGESEERLRETFERAREDAPAVIFFDELDSIAAQRDDAGDMENRIVGQLLSLMDGLDAREDVIVIGATNRVDALDPALRRGGRFDREIEIGVPNEAGRREILSVHTRRMPLAENVDRNRLAARTHGFVGADLESLVTEAALHALRRSRAAGEPPLDELTVTREDFEAAMADVEPSAMREHVAEQPTRGFDAVGDLSDAKATLERTVLWPLEYGPLFEAANTDPPTGVLLHGPPGTGKTLLARAVAAESGVNFIGVAGPELLDRYVGESEKAVRDVFERARQAAPAIVFFDEIDAVAADRSGASGDSGVGERVVSQLLTELDRAADHPTLVVLAATNRREALDPALLRPGRLETHVEVPAPDQEGRREIFAVHTREKPLAADVDLDDLAAQTAAYSGADIAAICREAAMRAIESVRNAHGDAANEHADSVELRHEHFEVALETVEPSLR